MKKGLMLSILFLALLIVTGPFVDASEKVILIIAGYDDADTRKAVDAITKPSSVSGYSGSKTSLLLDTSNGLELIYGSSDSSLGFYLRDFPEPFIKLTIDDVQEDVAIIIGSKASSFDVIAAANIQSNLVFGEDGVYTQPLQEIVFFASEIDEVPDRNLILIGGSRVNRITAQVLDLPYPTDKDSAEWQSLTGLDQSGRAVVFMLASPYGQINPICGNDICEFGESENSCPADCEEEQEDGEEPEEEQIGEQMEETIQQQQPVTERQSEGRGLSPVPSLVERLPIGILWLIGIIILLIIVLIIYLASRYSKKRS